MDTGPVLVIGGTRGIGRAVVDKLLAAGRSVAFTWTSSADAARALEAAAEGRAAAFRFELADRAAAGPLVEAVEERVGPLAGLVNCGAVRRDALLAMSSDADWDHVLDTNLGGPFRVCRAVVPGLLRRRAGAIVNVSSLAAYHGIAGQALYAASKAGLLALTRALARECGRRGVRVNAVVPGFVATDFVSDLPEAVVAGLRASECLPGGTGPGDVADTILFLLSDGARAITGQAIVVDAGTST